MLIILTCLFTVILIFADRWFTISEIHIGDIDKQVPVFGTQNILHKNIFFITVSQIESILLAANAHIKHITVEKEYPHSIKLLIQTHTPFAYFKANNGYFVVSDNGTVITKTRKTQEMLPIITYYQIFDYVSLNVGNNLSYKDIQAALGFLKKAQNLGISVDSVDINGLYLIRLNSGNKKLIFTAEKSREIQEYQFETIIHQFAIEGKNYKTLDVRFDKPLIELP